MIEIFKENLFKDEIVVKQSATLITGEGGRPGWISVPGCHQFRFLKGRSLKKVFTRKLFERIFIRKPFKKSVKESSLIF